MRKQNSHNPSLPNRYLLARLDKFLLYKLHWRKAHPYCRQVFHCHCKQLPQVVPYRLVEE